jgi:hypothetical protein
MGRFFSREGHFSHSSFEGREGLPLSSFPAMTPGLTNQHTYNSPPLIKEGVGLPRRFWLDGQ